MASLVWEMQIMEEREIAIEIGYEIDREQKKWIEMWKAESLVMIECDVRGINHVHFCGAFNAWE